VWGRAAVYDVVQSIDPAMAALTHKGSEHYVQVSNMVHRREAAKPNVTWQAHHTLVSR